VDGADPASRKAVSELLACLGGGHLDPGAVVEVVDVVSAQRDHQRAGQIVGGGGPPVADQADAQLLGGVGGVDTVMLPVGGEGGVGVAVTEFVERGLLPVQLLAAVVGELDRRQSGGQGVEQSAGVDLGQLAGVTHQHDLHGLPFGGRAAGRAGGCRSSRLRPPPAPTQAAAANPAGGRRPGRVARPGWWHGSRRRLPARARHGQRARPRSPGSRRPARLRGRHPARRSCRSRPCRPPPPHLHPRW
jgi:hypothetical protein